MHNVPINIYIESEVQYDIRCSLFAHSFNPISQLRAQLEAKQIEWILFSCALAEC